MIAVGTEDVNVQMGAQGAVWPSGHARAVHETAHVISA